MEHEALTERIIEAAPRLTVERKRVIASWGCSCLPAFLIEIECDSGEPKSPPKRTTLPDELFVSGDGANFCYGTHATAN